MFQISIQDRISLPLRAKILDLSERFIVVTFFGHFAYQTLQQYAVSSNVITALLFTSEFILFLVILFRRPSATLSHDPLDWLFGLTGSIAPLLIMPGNVNPLVPEAICLAIVMLGIFTQISAKIILGSSFGIVAANRGIKILGPYRLIRHPMYAGYTLTHIGLWLAMPSFRNAVLYSCALALQIVRIRREERILFLDPAYRDFAARVRYRLLPGIF